MHVYVLLFNAGTDNEGIHTLKVGDRNIVLMFEEEDDATRYGLMLEAQDFLEPTVEGFDAEDIEAFCDEADYECRLVHSGTLETPPESTVDSLDWNPDETEPVEPPVKGPSEFSQDELDRIRKKLEGLL